jgi:hypothetical protein
LAQPIRTTPEENFDALSRLDRMPLDQPEPELTYVFKPIVTHEAAYECLPVATRARLYGNLAHFVEMTYAGTLDQYLDVLAYHYDLSEHQAKRREYLRKVGRRRKRLMRTTQRESCMELCTSPGVVNRVLWRDTAACDRTS